MCAWERHQHKQSADRSINRASERRDASTGSQGEIEPKSERCWERESTRESTNTLSHPSMYWWARERTVAVVCVRHFPFAATAQSAQLPAITGPRDEICEETKRQIEREKKRERRLRRVIAKLFAETTKRAKTRRGEAERKYYFSPFPTTKGGFSLIFGN